MARPSDECVPTSSCAIPSAGRACERPREGWPVARPSDECVRRSSRLPPSVSEKVTWPEPPASSACGPDECGVSPPHPVDDVGHLARRGDVRCRR